MKVISIKLITGEEIIGRLEGEDGYLYNIDEPYIITYMSDIKYGQIMRLSPFMPCIEDRLFTILRKHIILTGDVDKFSQKYYIKCIEESKNLNTEPVDLNNVDLPTTFH